MLNQLKVTAHIDTCSLATKNLGMSLQRTSGTYSSIYPWDISLKTYPRNMSLRVSATNP